MFLSNCELKISLAAVIQNWQSLAAYSFPATCSAVVKANAYGLGSLEVARALYGVGCRDFFVASIDEAAQLRSLPFLDLRIYVLGGVFPGEERRCIDLSAIPVLCSLQMLRRWADVSEGCSESVLKVDTGMSRLGLPESELSLLCTDSGLLAQAGVGMVMSHLACADESSHPLNFLQLQRFNLVRARLLSVSPFLRFSLANSAAITLSPDYHFDLVRPGIAIYGGMSSHTDLKLRSVVGLSLPVIQRRRVEAGESVGYGAVDKFDSPRELLVVAGGYADGFFRSMSGRLSAYSGGFKLPLVGRISMDTMIFDSTLLGGVAASVVELELLGESQGVRELAEAADTISYEVLTSLGGRIRRVYQ
ncbi:MAG: alanine racemase [Flavobacteriales bacterium]|jgi:alanine racemase